MRGKKELLKELLHVVGEFVIPINISGEAIEYFAKINAR
jgi:hypothetical protein